ncbi:HAMP domain-containing protein [bacterium]|nr:HAMP domain-containing protein [bacterium]
MKQFVSIKTKMIFLFIPFIILILLFMIFFLNKVRNGIIKKQYLENFDFTVNNISNALEFPLWTENIDSIENILKGLEDNKSVDKIIIYKNNTIFYYYKRAHANESRSIEISRNIASHKSADFLFLPSQKETKNKIVLFLNEYTLNQEVNKYFNYFLGFLLFIIFILIISFYFFVDSLSVPIIDLSNKVNDITRMDITKTIDIVDRNDEIGLLANNFEKMRKEILTYSQQLETWNKELEKTVSMKTEELNSKNEELQATITQLKDLNENYMNINKKLQVTLGELSTAKEKAEEANKIKTQFISMISHELRTPLTSIIGFSQLIANEIIGEINNNQKDSLKNIESSAKDLLNLINDLIDVSKLDLKKFKIAMKEIKLDEFIEKIEMEVSPLLNKVDLDFIVEKECFQKTGVFDSLRIKQVILNFITNSLKFTQKGYIKLITRQVQGMKVDKKPSKKGKFLMFAVEDTGIGLKEEELDNVFKTFYQVDNGLSREKGGTGLGLAISREIVQLHKGRIFVKSTYGVGTTFYFIIPLNNGKN